MLTILYLDVVRVSQKHSQAINAHAPASSRWQPVLHRCAVGLIHDHGFMVTLSFGLGKYIEEKVTKTLSASIQCMLEGSSRTPLMMWLMQTGISGYYTHTPWLAVQRAPSV